MGKSSGISVFGLFGLLLLVLIVFIGTRVYLFHDYPIYVSDEEIEDAAAEEFGAFADHI